MIIRRRHTKNFVTLENQLVRDQRLSLDEHGMLHYLLSLPDDWEVSRANCMRFWGIGREKAARIFRSLRRYGWARVERMHGEDGTFLGVRWIITDEPGEEVSEAVLDQDTDAEDEAPEAVALAADADHDTANPDDGSTVVRVNHGAGNPYHGDYIDSKKTDSEENRLSHNGAREKSLEEEGSATFTDLLKTWPPDHVLSRVAAEQAWQRLTRLSRHQANKIAPRYLDDCRSKSRKVCDLTTYLREERFDRFASGPAGGKPAPWLAKPNTPQWHRWRDYLVLTGKSVTFMDSQAAKGVGWSTPQEWPPALPPRPEGAPSADATGPPTELSDEDTKHFT